MHKVFDFRHGCGSVGADLEFQWRRVVETCAQVGGKFVGIEWLFASKVMASGVDIDDIPRRGSGRVVCGGGGGHVDAHEFCAASEFS